MQVEDDILFFLAALFSVALPARLLKGSKRIKTFSALVFLSINVSLVIYHAMGVTPWLFWGMIHWNLGFGALLVYRDNAQGAGPWQHI